MAEKKSQGNEKEQLNKQAEKAKEKPANKSTKKADETKKPSANAKKESAKETQSKANDKQDENTPAKNTTSKADKNKTEKKSAPKKNNNSNKNNKSKPPAKAEDKVSSTSKNDKNKSEQTKPKSSEEDKVVEKPKSSTNNTKQEKPDDSAKKKKTNKTKSKTQTEKNTSKTEQKQQGNKPDNKTTKKEEPAKDPEKPKEPEIKEEPDKRATLVKEKQWELKQERQRQEEKLNKAISNYIETVKEHEDDFKNKDDKAINISGNLEKIIPLDTDKPSEIFRKVLTIISTFIIVVCLISLVVSTIGKGDGKGSPNSGKNPVADFASASNIDDSIYPKGMQNKFKKLYIANKKIVGIISVDGTSIEQPVVQGDDNEYYLSHNFYNNVYEEGTVFLDANCKSDLNLTNTVLYANNNKLETFNFSQILDYKKLDTYKNAPVISFNTLYKDYRWKIYACFLTTVNASDDNGYVFDYASQSLNADNFAGYVEQIDMRKIYTTGVDLLPTDKLLTISVPCFDFDTNDRVVETRFVVIARMLREGESEEVDSSQIKNIPNPYKPQVYYDTMGKENPNINITRWNP